MFDEMSARKSVHIRESGMALVGTVNFARRTRCSDCEKDGDHVLIFLFRPFLGGWSPTVETFCTSSTATGLIVAKFLLLCIVHLLFNAGAIVESVTCDNSSPNRPALRNLGEYLGASVMFEESKYLKTLHYCFLFRDKQ